jgi:glycine cleavage system H protein
MARPADLRYLKSHEWARRDGDLITVGVSDYAVEQLNREIVFLELPPVGRQVKQGSPFGVIEAVKAAYDLYAPVSGTIEESSQAVVDDPSLAGNDPFGAGWLIKIRPDSPGDWDNLLSGDDYQKVLDAGEAH